MLERRGWLDVAVSAASLAAGLGMMAVSIATNGGGRRMVDADRRGTDTDAEDDADEGGLPPVVERAFAQVGISGSRLHERTEQVYAMYRLAKAVGMSDADIAKLVVQKAGEKLDDGLERVRPVETRPLFEAIEEGLLRVAAETDSRLDLGGDLMRRMREHLIEARANREQTLAGLDRTFEQGRSELRRLLRRTAGGE
jgi:hypothetical protein